MPWFDLAPWLIALAPFAGLFAAAFAKRKDPAIVGDRVYRHDPPARISHWTHALGVAVCLVSGIILGLRFTPAFVEDGPAAVVWMNVHFVAAVSFLFGTFFYLGNTIISRHRFKEHLPSRDAVVTTIHHYGRKLGFKNLTPVEEDKYFESEKIAYLMALGCSVLLVLSGLVKALAHVFLTLPDAFMNVITWTHDLAAVLMLLFFLAHVFFAAIAPMAWRTFPSMLFGWMPRDEAEHEHVAWMRRLKAAGRIEGPASTPSAAAEPTADGAAAASIPEPAKEV